MSVANNSYILPRQASFACSGEVCVSKVTCGVLRYPCCHYALRHRC
jgi:hypothetical protein